MRGEATPAAGADAHAGRQSSTNQAINFDPFILLPHENSLLKA